MIAWQNLRSQYSFALILCATVAGCGGPSPPQKAALVVVAGSLTVNGNPEPDVRVVLRPIGGQPVDEFNGSLEFMTSEPNDGVPLANTTSPPDVNLKATPRAQD